MALELAHENIWFDKWRVDDAEREFYEKKAQGSSGLGSLASQIAKARQEIQNSLVSGGRTASGSSGGGGGVNADLLNRITKLEGENTSLTKTVSTLEQTIMNLTTRLEKLEFGSSTTTNTTATPKKSEPMETEEEDDDDDDVDLFGSDEEDEEAERIKEERLKAYAEKKAKKPGPIAKSSVLLDCKPWDDETNMAAMEVEIRKIEMDGLVWGASKLVPLAYGIQKLSILCTVEDEKVSIDDLSEKIQEIEDYVQSVDIGAFNKI
ncbi:elongation factor 1-delta isoform X2 [Procambarus clarkii]|uniref:elongation factor 1-delta isoform X2 n=1 Tax=Procambarus clarkii TaxID=6728 RepID=UPI001E6778CF|nr:elongation factor 1-delta-like isoform X1 [Procambarus clarkii]XP_045583618.1 elongation factor 1-delta-like isoform X1 [Procambarus clarkii]